MKANEFIVDYNIGHEDIDEGWKDWVAGAAMGASALAASPDVDAKQMPSPPAKVVTAPQAAQPDTTDRTIKTILRPEAKILIKTAQAAGIKGTELAQFVAQCAHETADFTRLKEIGGKLDFKKYDPAHNPRKAKILGNVKPGDGARYHGRGYIQLTGRDNYRRAGEALGLPLEKHPELAERPDVAARIAVWYWQNRVQPQVNNFSDTAQVTRPINAGLKGLPDRHQKFADIISIMKSGGKRS